MKDLTFTNGNKKLKCTIFSLPCLTTCKPGLDCRKYCYAKKAEMQYPAVKPCRDRNFKETLNDSFVQDATKLLWRKKSNFVRVHESGDFYSKEYTLKWFEIMNCVKYKEFYAYTKRDDLFTPEILALKPANLTLIYSYDKIQKVDLRKNIKPPKGFDKVAVISETKTNCPAQKEKAVKCMADCTKCIDKNNKMICFKIH